MIRLAQWLRYGTVSIVATLTSMTVLGVLVTLTAIPAGWANVAATGIGTVPSFELNRRWVWGRTGKRSLGGEVGPFWVLSFAGLVLSTVTVALAAAWAADAGADATSRTIVVEAASVAAFGSLWIAQFVILDRVLFRPRPQRAASPLSGSSAVTLRTAQPRESTMPV